MSGTCFTVSTMLARIVSLNHCPQILMRRELTGGGAVS